MPSKTKKIPSCNTFYKLKHKSNDFSWEQLLSVNQNRNVLIDNIERFLDDGFVPDEAIACLTEDELEVIRKRFDEKPKPKYSSSYTEILKSSIPRGYEDVFDDFGLGEVSAAEKIIKDSGIEITPSPLNVFRSLYLTPLRNIKVVIIGQNPYHQISGSGELVANGLAFSTHPNAPIQPSLKNIYSMASSCIPGFVKPDHGDLSVWAMRGVLLLNTSFTSEVGNSHNEMQKTWGKVLDLILKGIYENNPDVIFVTWGKDAQSLKLPSDMVTKIISVHPSPFNGSEMFISAESFKKVNECLVQKGISPIDWTIPKSRELKKEYESIQTKQQNFDSHVLEITDHM